MKRSRLSSNEPEAKPSLSPSPSPSPAPKRPKGEAKPKLKPDGNSNSKRPWTGDEYAALFKRVVEVGRAEACASFPGRTKNQAYQTWK